jgi:DNA polymerase
MSARDELRRYLEQRRDLGERELVLDSMTVDEAMARIDGGKANSASRGKDNSASQGKGDGGKGKSASREEGNGDASQEGNWRSAIRDAGGAPAEASAAPEAPDLPTSRQAPSSVPPRLAPLPLPTPRLAQSLFEVAAAVAACRLCPLYATATNPVPGDGNPDADFMIVGEAPGANEDQQGVPFVGQAGQLLTKIIGAIDLKREDVFIANVLKHRPPGNRNPLPEEVKACSPYLVRQIELVRPKVILALGTFAAQTLLETKLTIGKLRGQEHQYYGVPLVVTYHPAALLRNPAWKRPTWEDVQLARRILDRA